MMIKTLKFLVPLLVLSSCSTAPSGPGVLVLPGADKDFAGFQNDETGCRQFAQQQIAALRQKPDTSEEAQKLYDFGYLQCMYDKGHRVPLPADVIYDPEDFSAAAEDGEPVP